MVDPKGIDWTDVSFVVGTRSDLAPTPLPQPVYSCTCGNCETSTYTETEYPADVPILCNVCAANVASGSEEDSDTLLLFDLPNDVKARLLDMAYKKRDRKSTRLNSSHSSISYAVFCLKKKKKTSMS